jgi:photosystem II stability/assembly factor-like uncharacterized protein
MKSFKNIQGLILIIVLACSLKGYSTSRYWIATATANWNATTSWSASSGGTGGASVPVAGDTVNFNSLKNGNCTINAAVDVGRLNVQGYTGTLTQNSGIKIKIGTSNAVFNSGTFIGSTSSTDSIIVNGTFTLSGTAFTSTRGYLYLKNTVTYSSGVFSNGTGTVEFAGSVSQTIPALNFSNLKSSGTGARILASSGTIGIAGSDFTPGSNTYTITGSTINYNGTNSQGVAAFNYNNLAFSNNHDIKSIVLASSGTIGVAGTFTNTATFSSGHFVNTSSTIDYNGSGSQTIAAFDYNNLTSSSTGLRNLAASDTIAVANTFTKGGNTYSSITGSIFEYNGSGAQTVAAFAYNTLIISKARGAATVILGSGTISITGAFIPSASFTAGGGYSSVSTIISYNGTGAQTISAFDYNSLTLAGVRTSSSITFANSGTIGIAGTFLNSATFSTGGIITTGSTVEYKGSAGQTILALNYNNLTSSSSGGRVFASSGIIRVAGAFTKGANAYTVTGSTLEFNGTGAQTVPALDYYNLIVSGSRSGSVTFDNSATITIAKVFSPLATFSSGNYVTTGTTFDYKGTVPQSIAALEYNNLTSSSSGARSFATTGTVKINGAFTSGTNAYSDLGATGTGFTPKYTGVFDVLYDCYTIDTSIAFVTGNAGRILKTIDGGNTWSAQASNTVQDLFAISFFNSSVGMVVGNTGGFAKTSNGGTTWTAGTSGSLNYRSVIYKTIDTVFIGGATNTIKRSGDGGSTWTVMTTPVGSQAIYSITFTTNAVGYAVGSAATIWKTVNAGATWTALTPPAGFTDNLSSIKFTSSTTGFAVGINGKIITTTNSGTTWTTVASGVTDALSDVTFYDANNGYIVGGDVTNNTGTILKTTNGGSSWTVIYPGTARLMNFNLYNQNVGFMSGIDGNILKYTCCNDGGTVEFGSSSSQTIPALNYHHLTSSSTGARVLASAGTIGISGVLTRGSNTYTITGSSVDFNGGTQNIPACTFNNLTVSGSGDKTATGALVVNATLNIVAGRILNMGTNALSGTVSSATGSGTLKTQNTGATPIPPGKSWTPTVEYNSASAQTIVYGSYSSLNGTGGNRTFSSSDTVHISGVFTPGAGTYTVNGSVVDFNGGIQVIPLLTYNNLAVRGSGNKTAGGNITVNGSLNIINGRTLLMGTNALLGTLGSTNGTGILQTQNTGPNPLPVNKTWVPSIEYTNGSLQTIVYGRYSSLNGTGGNRTLSATDTVHVSGTFTPGGGTYTVTGSSVDFNGAAQSVPVLTYNNLRVSGSGTKTAAGNIIINGGIAINPGVIFDLATSTLTGTLSSISGTGTLKTQNTGSTPLPSSKTWSCDVEYNGVSQTIPAGTYSNIILSNSGTKTAAGNIVINTGFTINTALILDMATYQLTGTLTSIFGRGILKTQNTTSTPLPPNKTWTGEVQYNSSSSQTIVNGNYLSLTGTGGDRILSSTGTIGISGIFTPGSGTYTVTGSTINFNGAGAQSIPAFYYNNLRISGFRSSNNITLAPGTTSIKGNLSVNTLFSSGSYITTGSTFLFNGNSNQYINGITAAYFGKLALDKPAGKLILAEPVIVIQQLILDKKGIIGTTATNYLQISSTDTILGGSDSSYVCGPLTKKGEQAFTFALGDTTLLTGAYHPLKMTAPTGTGNLFTAQYFAHGQTDGDSLEVDSLESISTCEYWSINRMAGTGTIVPSVGWNSNSCNAGIPSDMAVSYWDTNRWRSLGQANVTAGGVSGIVGALRGPLSSLSLAHIGIGIALFKADAGTDKAICAGGNTILTASVNGGSGPVTYSWAPSTGLSASNILQPTASPTVTTTYTLTVTETTGLHRVRTDNVTVTVHPLPGVGISPASATICVGATVSLTPFGAESYVWNASATLITSTTTATAFPTTTTGYTVTGTDSYGCTNTASITVTVNPLPVITISPPSAGSIASMPVILTASGASTYLWMPGSLTGSTVTVYPFSETTYTVTGTGENGCTGSATAIVFVKPCNLEVDPGLIIPVCDGETVLVTASSSITGATYSWLSPVPGTPAITTGSISVDASTAGQWQVSLFLSGSLTSCVTEIVNVVLRTDCDEPINGCGFNNYGASVYVTPGTHLNVYCNLLNELGMDNSYTISKGEFESNGNINVKLDWIHNAKNNLFLTNTGISSLFGYGQKMRGNSNTHFSALNLDGNGVKKIEIDEYSDDRLDLKSNELFLGNYNFFMTNVAPASLSVDMSSGSPVNVSNTINRSNGFVSTDGTGYLSQEMLSGADYLFPTGSNGTIPFRYRPLEISGTANDNVSVNFKNAAYPSLVKAPSVVSVNNLFYHKLKHTAPSATDKKIKSSFAPSEGAFQSMAHWEQDATGSLTYWWGNTIGPNANNVPNVEGLIYALSNGPQNFNGEPFALAESGFYINTTGFGTPFSTGSTGDNNNDGVINGTEVGGDANNNGVIDNGEIAGDCNGDGMIGSDEMAGDVNCDGSTTGTEQTGDVNGDGVISGSETSGDGDGDGVIDNGETSGQTNSTSSSSDINNDGVIGAGETSGDSNGNGTIDPGEITGDTNGNGVIDNGEVAGDTNGNGTIDPGETAGDANGDGVLGAGECASTVPSSTVALAGDANNNGSIDGTEVAGDLDNNGAIGPCEIAGDVNGNGVIDPGESSGDTNGNGSIDIGETLGDDDGNGSVGAGESPGESSTGSGSGVVITITSTGSSTGDDLDNPYGTGGTVTLTPTPPVGPYTMTIVPNECAIPGRIDFTIAADGTIDPATVQYGLLDGSPALGKLSPEVYTIDNINSGLIITSAPSPLLTECVNSVKVSMGSDFVLVNGSESVSVSIPTTTPGISVGPFVIYDDANSAVHTSASLATGLNTITAWPVTATPDGVYHFELTVTAGSVSEIIKGQFILK